MKRRKFAKANRDRTTCGRDQIDQIEEAFRAQDGNQGADWF
jgi:hypothetical protein